METKEVDEQLQKEIEKSHENPKSNPLKKRYIKHFVIFGSIFVAVCAVAIPLIVHYVVTNIDVEDASNYNVSKGLLYNINEYLKGQKEIVYDYNKVDNITSEENDNTIVFKIFVSNKNNVHTFFTITLATKPDGGLEKVIGELRRDIYDSFKDASYVKDESYQYQKVVATIPKFEDINISLVKYNVYINENGTFTSGFYTENNKVDAITTFNLANTDDKTFIIHKNTGIYNEAKKSNEPSKTSYYYSYLTYLSKNK